MKTISIKLYEYSELSKEAKAKALAEWNDENNDYLFLEEDIKDTCTTLLTKYGITGDPVEVSYSLSYCQGDGAMFYGTFTWKDYSIKINHVGRYSHSNSKEIEILNEKTGINAPEAAERAFEIIYQSICEAMETRGYAHIEAERSEEFFISACEANDYTFEADGTMRNA